MKNSEKKATHEPFSVPLEAILVEDLDGHRKGFEADSHVLVDVSLVHRSEPSFSEDVIGAEALGDGFQLEQCEGDCVGVDRDVPRVLEGSRRGRVAQVREGAALLLLQGSALNWHRETCGDGEYGAAKCRR